jgi:hypothetical protein
MGRQPHGASASVDSTDIGTRSVHAVRDVTLDTDIKFGPSQYDSATGDATVSVRLRNASATHLPGSLQLVVTNVASNSLGSAVVSNADNLRQREGAVWTLSSANVNGRLAPGARSSRAALPRHTAAPGCALGPCRCVVGTSGYPRTRSCASRVAPMRLWPAGCQPGAAPLRAARLTRALFWR